MGIPAGYTQCQWCGKVYEWNEGVYYRYCSNRCKAEHEASQSAPRQQNYVQQRRSKNSSGKWILSIGLGISLYWFVIRPGLERSESSDYTAPVFSPPASSTSTDEASASEESAELAEEAAAIAEESESEPYVIQVLDRTGYDIALGDALVSIEGTDNSFDANQNGTVHMMIDSELSGDSRVFTSAEGYISDTTTVRQLREAVGVFRIRLLPTPDDQ